MRPLLLLVAVVASASAPYRSPVHLVRAGDDLQAALNAARAGDEIRLQADATFTGNFVLPVFDGDEPITLRSDLPDGDVPAANQRVTPASASRFARLVSPGSEAALRTAPSARHWRVVCLEFGANRNGAGDIIEIGDGSPAQSQLSQVPQDIVLDRVYVHGDPENGQKRGIALNGADVTVRNSYVSDIKGVGVDTQAIAGWNGPGPFSIENNYLEAAGEVLLFGGADPSIANLIPSDILVRFNHMTRPLEWRGSRWQIKNVFELKNARRVVVDSNLIENNWVAAQPGYAVLFTPRNQGGRCAWCTIESIAFVHNVVRHVSAAVNVLGHDSAPGSRAATGIRIEGNLFEDVTTRLGGNGWGMLVGDGPRDLTIDRNTFIFDGTTLLYAYGTPKIQGFQFTRNAAPHGQYGINGAGASTGTAALQKFFDRPVVTDNWLSGGPNGRYPAGNRYESPFDPARGGAAGADVGQLRALAGEVARGVMTLAPQPPKTLTITSSAK
jgi:hypothetical protein